MIKDAKVLVNDDFSAEKYPKRNAARGSWKIADGAASVQQEEALYKKYKNHGPIMIYDALHTDAHAVVEFKPSDCKAVVFTLDAAEGGHAFRIKLRTKGKTTGGPPCQIVTYAAKKEGQDKAETIILNGKDLPKLVNNEWNRIEITVVGDQASVTLRDKTVHVTHSRIAQ